MTDLQRFCWTQHGMRIVSDGEWYKREDIDAAIEEYKAEIDGLWQRVADLEAAAPVATVLAAQIDDVICGIGDCEILPHMDPRRHAVCQCLIAAILETARLRDFVRLVREEWDVHTPPRITEALKKMDAPDA